jgi:hypothetical protein
MFLFTAFTLTASLLLEGKVIEYQYIRIFWTIVPFISVGCFFAAGSIRTAWKRAHSSRVTAIWMRLVCVALSVTFLFFSPVYILADRAMHRLSLYREGQYSGGIIVDDETLDREKGMYALAKRIEPKLQPEDNIFVFGERPALYFHLKRTPPTMLISDGFVTASWAPQRWKDKILHDLDSEKPRFIFIGKNDVMSIINESSDDSWQFFLNWPKFHEMVINEYSPIDTVSAFMAFERK